MAGCGPATTGAEIEQIMAEARRDAAKDLARARSEWGVNAPLTQTNAARVEASANSTSER